MACNQAETPINILPNNAPVIDDSLTKIGENPHFEGYQAKSVEILNQETLDLSEFQLQNLNTNTLKITNRNKKYLEFALIAKQFIDDVKENKETASDQQLVEIRDEFYALVDELKQLDDEIHQINDFSEEERFILSDIYAQLFTQEALLKDAFPPDYHREFENNTGLTKSSIVTESHTIERLASKCPSFITKIDAVIEQVENGRLTPQQGSKEIDKIWSEWKSL